jgi:hypothetical protein
MTDFALLMLLLSVCCVLIAVLSIIAVLIAYIHEREHELRGKGMREQR